MSGHAASTTSDPSPSPAGLHVMLVVGKSLFREALLRGLRWDDAFETVTASHDAADAVAKAAATQPDVVVLDADLRPRPAETVVRLRLRSRRTQVILLVGSADLSRMADAMEVGVRACVAKDGQLGELVEAIKRVASGAAYIPPAQLRPLLDELLARREDRYEAIRLIAELSHRERQVLELLAAGGNNETIARDLVIAPDTARTHVQNVLRKLGLHSRLEAAAFATRYGVLAGSPLEHAGPAVGAASRS